MEGPHSGPRWELASSPPCSAPAWQPGTGDCPLDQPEENGLIIEDNIASGCSYQDFPSLEVLAKSWPELAALKAAASSPNIHGLRCSITSFVSHTRVEFAAALQEARRVCSASRQASRGGSCSAVSLGQARHQAALDVRQLGSELLAVWRLSHEQVGFVFQ